MAVAEASFNISIEAISLGLISLSVPLVLERGKPSTTTYGLELALIEFCPRTNRLGCAPGTDEVLVTDTPGTEPSTACMTLVMGSCVNLSFGTEDTAPVTSIRF